MRPRQVHQPGQPDARISGYLGHQPERTMICWPTSRRYDQDLTDYAAQ